MPSKSSSTDCLIEGVSRDADQHPDCVKTDVEEEDREISPDLARQQSSRDIGLQKGHACGQDTVPIKRAVRAIHSSQPPKERKHTIALTCFARVSRARKYIYLIVNNPQSWLVKST